MIHTTNEYFLKKKKKNKKQTNICIDNMPNPRDIKHSGKNPLYIPDSDQNPLYIPGNKHKVPKMCTPMFLDE